MVRYEKLSKEEMKMARNSNKEDNYSSDDSDVTSVNRKRIHYIIIESDNEEFRFLKKILTFLTFFYFPRHWPFFTRFLCPE